MEREGGEGVKDEKVEEEGCRGRWSEKRRGRGKARKREGEGEGEGEREKEREVRGEEDERNMDRE